MNFTPQYWFQIALSLMVLGLPLLNGAHAHTLEEETHTNSSDKLRATPALRERTYKKLSAIQTLIEQQQLAQAKAQLNELLSTNNLNGYEMAQALNLQAYMQHSAEQYEQAISSYRKILSQKDLPSAFQGTVLYSITQLYIAVDNYPEALHMLQHWFAQTEAPTAAAYGLLAQLQYQEKQYQQAENNINKAISLYQQDNKTPKEAWWQLLLAIHYESQRYENMVEVLINLTTWYSKANYWTQLASIYGQLNQPQKQLQTLDAAHIKGLLTKESHLLQLAHLLQENAIPYSAAKILKKGIDDGVIKKTRQNWQQLASAWYEAQELEKAVLAMEQAAALADNAQPYLQLAYLLLDLDRYPEALTFAEKALQKVAKSDYENTIKIHTLIGTAHYYQKQFDAADRAFGEALQQATLHEQELDGLQSWKEHNQIEKRRYQLVKEYL